MPLRVIVANAPVSLDPHQQNDDATYSVLGNVLEGLTGLDTDMRVQPALALRWESPDDLTWQFHLRPRVRFHDGRSLGAADVVASLERARHHPKSRVAANLVAVRDVRALDELTVQVITQRPYPVLLNKLSFVYIVPRDAPAEITDPLGTGPYYLRSFTPGSTVELERFVGYWGPPPAAARVTMLPVDKPADRVGLLASGHADVVASIPMDEVPPPSPSDRFHFAWRTSLSVSTLGMRVDRAPLSDVRVRRALHLALDRPAVVHALLGGHAQPMTQLVSPQVFGFDPSLRLPGRDVAAARRLLAEAGHADGIDLELEHQAGAGRLVALMAGQLAEAGIRVRPALRTFPELYARMVAGQASFFFSGFSCSSGDASDLFDSLLHSAAADRGYGDANFTGYASAALDELIEQSGQTLDVGRRGALLRSAMRLAMQDLPVIPLWDRPLVFGLRNDIEWQPRPDGRPYVREMFRRTR